MAAPQSERRARLERLLADAAPPLHLTPMTRDRATAPRVARAIRGRRPRRRDRQAGGRPVPAGQARDDQGEARAHRRLRRRRLPLAQERARTRSARCCSASTTTAARCTTSASRRRSRWRCARQLAQELAPLRENALEDHPWREWAEAASSEMHAHARRPEPLERGQGSLVGAAADRARVRGEVRPPAGRPLPPRGDVFLRWRPDKPPRDCRYDQLEVTPPYELEKVFGAVGSRPGSERLLSAAAALPARAAGSRGCASRWKSGRASSRPARRQARDARPPRDDAPSSARARRARPPSLRARRSRSADASARGAATAARAAARRAASGSAAATARRPARRARAAPTARAARSSEPGCSSMPACRSPISAKRAGIVASVKSAGSQRRPRPSVSGADTRASGVGRTE